MMVTFHSDIVKIPARQLQGMSLASVVKYILSEPTKEANISFSSLHPIYVSGLDEDISVKLTIALEAN